MRKKKEERGKRKEERGKRKEERQFTYNHFRLTAYPTENNEGSWDNNPPNPILLTLYSQLYTPNSILLTLYSQLYTPNSLLPTLFS
jgi:hypothetical protein